MNYELKVYDPEVTGHIDWNKNQLQSAVDEIASRYSETVVTTAEDAKGAKEDLSALRKIQKEISDRRIEVKKQFTAPITQFELEVKEAAAPITTLIEKIDGQVKGYEEQLKAKKRQLLEQFFEASKATSRFDDMDTKKELAWLTFDRIFEKKWMNATVTEKKAQSEIEAKVREIEGNLHGIIGLASSPTIVAAVRTRYEETLDMSNALTYHSILRTKEREEQERQEAEARRKAEEEKRKAEEAKTTTDRLADLKARLGEGSKMPIPAPEETESITGPESIEISTGADFEGLMPNLDIPLDADFGLPPMDTQTVVYHVTGTENELLLLENFLYNMEIKFRKEG